MEKTVINLDKWGLLNYGTFFCAFGIADNHPKLGKNITISRTSGIIKVEEKEDTYIFETHNSIYVCKLGNISDAIPYDLCKTDSKSKIARVYNKYYRYILYKSSIATNKPISEFGIRLSEDEIKEFKRIEELAALCDKERAEKVKLHEAILLEDASKYENCIFIDLSSISQGSPAAFNINGKTGIINPRLHMGMFTDTVLYGFHCEDGEYIDFRYYVKPMSLESYSWTENIERVVIRNSKEVHIRFNHRLIKPGEILELTREDAYNTDESSSLSDEFKDFNLDDLFK